MKRYLFALAFALGVTVLATPAVAGTPDGKTPAREDVCNPLKGAAYGTCNAYCEAQDCDGHARPSCNSLRRKFKKLTGTTVFPCDKKPCGFEAAPLCGGSCQDGYECMPRRTEAGPSCICRPMVAGMQADSAY
jgi:hypothetical protein